MVKRNKTITAFLKKTTGQRPFPTRANAEQDSADADDKGIFEIPDGPSAPAAQSDPHPDTGEVVYITNNDSSLNEWIGFKRSTKTYAGRHYKAKCIYCNLGDISGRKDALARHKASCPDMPDSIKKMVAKVAPKPVVEKIQTIPQMFLDSMTQQARSDFLLKMNWVTFGLPFR